MQTADINQQEIGTGFQRGERWAFEAAARLYFTPVVNFIAHLLRDQDKSVDLAQEAFFLACRAHKKFDPERPLLPWLYQIARNLAYKEYNRRKKQALVSLDDEMESIQIPATNAPNPRGSAGNRELMVRIEKAIDRLKPKYKDVLILRMIQGLPSEKVAQLLDIPVPTVNTRTFRALEQLRRLTQQEGISENELFP